MKSEGLPPGNIIKGPPGENIHSCAGAVRIVFRLFLFLNDRTYSVLPIEDHEVAVVGMVGGMHHKSCRSPSRQVEIDRISQRDINDEVAIEDDKIVINKSFTLLHAACGAERGNPPGGRLWLPQKPFHPRSTRLLCLPGDR